VLAASAIALFPRCDASGPWEVDSAANSTKAGTGSYR
jgi:hypothetical protein